jgi:PST family polysaccharide transporter
VSTKAFFANTRWILLIQVVNQIFPLLLVPYLTRTLGVELYGVVAFMLGIAAFSLIFTDFGFGLYGTYEVSRNSSNVEKNNELLGAVFACKIVLLCVVAAAILGFALNTNTYAAYKFAIALTILAVAGQTFQPIWFFQGIEQMLFLAGGTLFARGGFVLAVFLAVDQASDYWAVVLFNGLSHTIIACIGIWGIFKRGYRPAWPGTYRCYHTFISASGFFWSRLATATYTAGGTLYLGFMASPSQVGIYSAAEQIYKGVQSLFLPLSQALYPTMVKTRDFFLLRKVIIFSIGVCVAGLAVGLCVGHLVIKLIFGPEFSEAYPLLVLFLLCLSINVPSVLMGYPLLGALGAPGLANRSVVVAGIIHAILLCVFFISGISSAVYLVMSVIFVEAVVLFLRTTWSRKRLRECSV